MSFLANTRRRLALGLASVPILGEQAVASYLRRRYNRRVVTPAKVRNFILAQKERHSRALHVRSRPWILNLDTFSGCNLKCPFCPTGTGQIDRRVARMPVEKAKHVIDMVKEHALEIRLYNWGEPFLNPHVFEIIRYAHDAGLYTVVNSNLSVSVDDLPAKIIDSRLDRLQASVDGISQEALEVYRRRANADLVFSNVTKLSEERRRRGVDHPTIALAFLVFRHNEDELADLEAKRLEIGADEFHPRRAFVFHDSLVPEHPEFTPLQSIFSGTCGYLYSELTVEASGAVSPCCTNTSERWDLGAVEDFQTLDQIWNGPVYRGMRAVSAGIEDPRKHSEGQELLCEHCALVGECDSNGTALSPLPPSLVADGVEYDHGFDNLPIRQPGAR